MGLDPVQKQFIATLYKEMDVTLKHNARNLLWDKALADEVVQETFRIACAKPQALMESESPKGWIVKTMHYVVDNVNRTTATLNAHLVSYALLEELPDKETFGGVEVSAACEDMLGKDDYKLLKLIVFQRQTFAEAANILNISPAACAKRYQRAKRKLENFFEKNQNRMSK